jgi:hypothetical protein
MLRKEECLFIQKAKERKPATAHNARSVIPAVSASFLVTEGDGLAPQVAVIVSIAALRMDCNVPKAVRFALIAFTMSATHAEHATAGSLAKEMKAFVNEAVLSDFSPFETRAGYTSAERHSPFGLFPHPIERRAVPNAWHWLAFASVPWYSTRSPHTPTDVQNEVTA